MALAHKAFRFPAMSYLKLPDGFSWIFFHKQNQSIGKSLLCEDPTGRSQGNFNPQQTWPLLLIKTEIQCPNSWFGVRNFACQGRVHLRRIWRKLHFVGSSTPKLIHSLKLIFNLKKKQDFIDNDSYQKSQISPLYRKTFQPCVGKKNLQPEICDR